MVHELKEVCELSIVESFSSDQVFHAGIAQQIITRLTRSKSEILNLVYSFTNPSIAEAIFTPVAKGVKYTGVWD